MRCHYFHGLVYVSCGEVCSSLYPILRVFCGHCIRGWVCDLHLSAVGDQWNESIYRIHWDDGQFTQNLSDVQRMDGPIVTSSPFVVERLTMDLGGLHGTTNSGEQCL